MGEKIRVELELDEDRHCELCREADRLGVSPEELTRRALAAWLVEMIDEGNLQQQMVAEA